jgi:hypothetical protein
MNSSRFEFVQSLANCVTCYEIGHMKERLRVFRFAVERDVKLIQYLAPFLFELKPTVETRHVGGDAENRSPESLLAAFIDESIVRVNDINHCFYLAKVPSLWRSARAARARPPAP